jgi:NAD-dependent SIR2 family protein deacetylase
MDNGKNPGKDRYGLWDKVTKELNSNTELYNLVEFGLIVKYFSEIELKDEDEPKSNGIIKNKNLIDIEALLSKAQVALNFIDDSKGKIRNTKTEIEKIIRDECSLELDPKGKHHDFLKKLSARNTKDPRLKLFTTNYDTLFEQAASGDFGIIDGFSFTNPRVFNGRFFDWDYVIREKSRIKEEDNFVSNIFHLYKLHGSVNWDKKSNNIQISNDPENPLIVYPASNKFESSFEQPYFEMMSRFQQELRKDDILLISIGFSFYDKHICNVIKEAVSSNPGFRLLIVNYSGETGNIKNGISIDNPNYEGLLNKQNVIIVDEKFSDFTDNIPINETYYKKPSINEYN